MKTATQARPVAILLSFTGTMDAVADGTITAEDLDSAIYCFGCMRSRMTDGTAEEIVTSHAQHQRQVIHVETVDLIRQKALEADSNDRAVWRRDFEEEPESGLYRLSQVLERSGLEPLNPNLPPAILNSSSGLKTAIERVNNKNRNKRVLVVTSDASV